MTQNLVDNQMYLSGQPLVNLSRNGYNIGVGDSPPYAFTTFAYQQNMAVTPDFAAVANHLCVESSHRQTGEAAFWIKS